jgi:Bifunctional DNA primase/polymerase, N-terminal
MRRSEPSSNPLIAALRAAALGLRIHPLLTKRAILEDWPSQATVDPCTIAEWLNGTYHAYGIVCDDVAVIDTDTRELAAWWAENMPPTAWRVHTPHGGTHFYYRSVPNLRNAVKAHRGWDVRAGGRGYVVGAGSTVDGIVYKLVGRETLDLPPFDPAWLPVEAVEPATLPAVCFPPTGKVRNLRSYIRRIISIEGQRGSDTCFRVACVLRDEGKTPDEALQYMLEWNQECAIPPWTVKELLHKICDSYAKLSKGS